MPKSKMVDCQNLQTQLSAYFDNELQSWKRLLIKWHLKRCTECSKKYTDLHQTHTLLNSIEQVRCSDDFLSNIMARANSINIHQKERLSLFKRFGSFVEGIQVWVRGNIRAYNPLYIGGFIVGVIMMLGVTLYPPKIDKLNLFTQSDNQSIQKHQERLVAFEVILQQQPKRTLKIR